MVKLPGRPPPSWKFLALIRISVSRACCGLGTMALRCHTLATAADVSAMVEVLELVIGIVLEIVLAVVVVMAVVAVVVVVVVPIVVVIVLVL